MFSVIILLCLIGIGISIYTYLLEQKIKKNPNHKAGCDISDRASCTKPMKSKYANLFYFSNSLVALAYYVLIIILTLLNVPMLLLVASIIGALVTCVFAYLLYFKIKTLCILCTSLYLINFLILILAIKSY